ncbi:MAG: HAMP domain-containing histidine kinase [Acidobacteria bacterium]|nr:HAMP domain-containing histidine kinase [Acidobacteriota bacterium]MCL5288513.1 HAMP domain-containing histidine kinase [Acidobacteriota bacterium]
MPMRLKPSTWLMIAAWTLLVGGYAAVALLVKPGPNLTAFGDVMQCLVPLFANAGLLMNAGSTHWRRNAFWMLLALGCSMWMAGQLLWTYYEVVLKQPTPNPFVGDVIFFLHTVPMIGALALLPHARMTDRAIRHGYLDFLLLLSWWVYLYAFIVLPWQYIQPVTAFYGDSYNHLSLVENIVFVIGLGVLWLRTAGPWRWVYANLFAAAFCYSFGSLTINVAIDIGKYHTGSLYDIPLIASFVWFGSAGFLAFRTTKGSELARAEAPKARAQRTGESSWTSRMAMAAVLSLPVMATWDLAISTAPWVVQEFRIIVTLVALVVLTALVFLRQHLVDQERQRLLAASQESLENLRRLQNSYAQSEKMAALGQLAAGAAREINNPLTAILGYSDLLKDDEEMPPRLRLLAGKIQEQARRTKMLVNNLLSFARQLPVEKTFLDINSVLRGAVQLRTLDLREQNIRIELQSESVLPVLRGDPNQLLQVFYNLISNAVDAMEETRGGTLTVRALREKKNVVLEFSDTGPGIKDPSLVFDPFYSTKPEGKGNGLGLSICYGIIQEHGGHISCYNRPEGGATFRVELPAVAPMLPKLSTTASPQALSTPATSPAPAPASAATTAEQEKAAKSEATVPVPATLATNKQH